MAQPVWSIIIPCPNVETESLAVRAFQSGQGPTEPYEVLVAVGRNPSRQRNQAAAQAQGTYLVFLDSDVQPNPSYWEKLSCRLENPQVDLIGGPLTLPAGASENEKLFQALLAHPLLTGPVSSRYAPRGKLRRSSDQELILANLAIRRSVWTSEPGFQERLYPNEENEWMDRLARRGVQIWYDPALSLAREQRSSGLAFLAMLIRYGQGRTEQALVSRRFQVKRHLPGLALGGVVLLSFAIGVVAWIFGMIFYCVYGIALAGTVSADSGVPRWKVFLWGPFVPLTYAVGQWWGLLHRQQNDETCPVSVHRMITSGKT